MSIPRVMTMSLSVTDTRMPVNKESESSELTQMTVWFVHANDLVLIQLVDDNKFLDLLLSYNEEERETRLIIPSSLFSDKNLELILKYSKLFKALIRFGIKLGSSNSEIVDMLKAFVHLADRFTGRVKAVGLAGVDGEPTFIDVIIDCGEDEWDEALRIVFRYPEAKYLNVICERALFRR